MRRAVLDATLADLDAAYDRLESGLGLPAQFGRNLDALWDSLTADVEGPIEIVCRDVEAMRARIGPGFDRMLATLSEAAAARRDLRLVFE